MELLYIIFGGLMVAAFYLGRENYSDSMDRDKRQRLAVLLFFTAIVVLSITTL